MNEKGTTPTSQYWILVREKKRKLEWLVGPVDAVLEWLGYRAYIGGWKDKGGKRVPVSRDKRVT